MSSDSSIVASSAHGLTSKFGLLHMYDTYAFLDEHILKNNLNFSGVKKFLYILNLKLKSKENLNVISNFGGISVYANSAQFLNNYYTLDFEDDLNTLCKCEHVEFHKRLKAGQEFPKHLISFETFFY
jgi:hypothetical protein